MSVNNSLTKSKGQQRLGLTAYLTQNAVRDQINKVVGGKDGQKFIASVVSAVQANPQLQECTNSSILSAALLGSSLNLTPSPVMGNYYLVPFRNTKAGVMEAQFQIGYKGYIQLAIRSGYYKKLNVLPIKEGELIRFDPLDEEIEVQLIDDEDAREKAPTIGYYATFTYSNGFKKAIYWSRQKMQSHAEKYSQGYQKDLKNGTSFTFWSKNFDDMACKTMLRHLISRWGIMSTELQTAFESDMAVIHEDGTKSFVDTEEAPALEAPEPAPADPNATVSRAEEIITRAEEKIEAERKQKATEKKEAAPADPAAALFE
jgi:recombination protein RecT